MSQERNPISGKESQIHGATVRKPDPDRQGSTSKGDIVDLPVPPRRKKGFFTPLRIGMAGLLAAVGIGTLYQTNDTFQEGVDNNLGKLGRTISGEKTIEEKFPEVIDTSSVRIVDKEEMQKIWQETKVVDDEKHTFVLGLPFDEETIKNNPEIRSRSFFDRQSIIGIGEDLVDQLEQEGFKNITVYSGLKKGDGVGLTYDESQFEVSILENSIAGRGTEFIPAYSNITIMLRSKTDGKTYQSTLSVLWGEPVMQINSSARTYTVYENGTPIKSGQRIYTLSTDLQDYDGQGQKILFQQGQVALGVIGRERDPQKEKVSIFSAVSLTDSQGNKVVAKSDNGSATR